MPLIPPLPPSVTLRDAAPDYPVLEISHPRVTARVALHGGHLMEWIPAGQAPVLYLSPKAVLREGKAIRGGVPVCWPWFGNHPAGGGYPAHGVARTRFWNCESASESPEGVQLVLTLKDDDATRRLWPHPFELRLTLAIGGTLEMSLTMKHLGKVPAVFQAALHSYFSVGDIRKVTVRGLDHTGYFTEAGPPQAQGEHTQHGDIVIDREVDRQYHAAPEVRLADASLSREIVITGTGSSATVVWNPWIEKAARLADLPDTDYRSFLCIETACLSTSSRLELRPGGSHTMSARIRCRPLAAELTAAPLNVI
ncbi:MAG: aldose 1-epimerase [Verrucomicrobiales bacterium]|nr:aldose 1-epimerase [Verrucomicrobiales bacterium]